VTDSEFLDDRDCEPKAHTLSLRQALALALHCMQKQRIWNGMGWTYNPLPARDYVPAMEKLREALAQKDEAPAVALTAAEQGVLRRALKAASVRIAAPPQPEGGAWRPIDTAPADMSESVVVRWTNSDGEERREFDIKQDGCWIGWHDHAEHVEIIGGHGVSYDPPYQHWLPMPAYPPAALPESAELSDGEIIRIYKHTLAMLPSHLQSDELRVACCRAVLAAARGTR
jgi:hypothetical protein